MQKVSTKQDIQLASWAQNTQPSTIQEMLAIATQPDVLSFALGLPAAELFPAEAYAQATARVIAADTRSLQYGPPCYDLKRHIVALMTLRGVACNEDQIFLTTGAQQAMSLLARLLLNAQGSILLEESVYSGILQAVEPLQPHILTVPTHPKTGIDLEAVAALFERGARPAFLYIITDGHNPVGISLSLEKRRHLVDLARQYHIPILEDDAYGMLHYDTQILPPLQALNEDGVFYIGSFSKILAPALRVGWIVAPKALLPLLATLKEGSDINTATLAQRTIAAYLETGHLPDHIVKLRQEYKARRDAMIETLKATFPPGTSYATPRAGMFIWVELPGKIEASAVLQLTLTKERVAFVPGDAFSADGSSHASHCLRLNFSHCSSERIKYGIALIARQLQSFYPASENWQIK